MCYWYRPDEMSLRLLYFCGFTTLLYFWHYSYSFKISAAILLEFSVAYWLLHLTTRLGLLGFQAGNGASLRLTEAMGNIADNSYAGYFSPKEL
jgi:hypothetical protein